MSNKINKCVVQYICISIYAHNINRYISNKHLNNFTRQHILRYSFTRITVICNMYEYDVYRRCLLSVFAVTPKNKLWVEKKKKKKHVVSCYVFACIYLLEIKEISGTEKGNNFFFSFRYYYIVVIWRWCVLSLLLNSLSLTYIRTSHQ